MIRGKKKKEKTEDIKGLVKAPPSLSAPFSSVVFLFFASLLSLSSLRVLVKSICHRAACRVGWQLIMLLSEEETRIVVTPLESSMPERRHLGIDAKSP
jgi:hypothetical protein